MVGVAVLAREMGVAAVGHFRLGFTARSELTRSVCCGGVDLICKQNQHD